MEEVLLVAYTKATMKAVDKYVKNNYDRLAITIPKGRKGTIEAYAKEHGESINGLVNTLLRELVGLTEEEWKNVPEDEPGA